MEFDEPYVLMKNKDGHLYKLVKELGDKGVAHLSEMAESAHIQKKSKETTASTYL